jgi:hypothetical protein
VFVATSDILQALTRGLRDEFDLHGIPIRIKTRVAANPYNEKRSNAHGGGEWSNKPTKQPRPEIRGRGKKGQLGREQPAAHKATKRAAAVAKATKANQANKGTAADGGGGGGRGGGGGGGGGTDPVEK